MNVILLSDWLKVCEEAGVEAVPADLVLETTKTEIMAAMDGPSDLWDVVEGSVDWEPEGVTEEVMYRWDCCAPLHLKRVMGKQPEVAPIVPLADFIDDPRLFDIMCGYEEEAMRLYMRPWVPAVMEGGWPVEFRVFVHGGSVIGVSSYYPQRPLPDKYGRDARLATMLTNQLIPFAAPAFTADWLLRASDGKLVFLEGGPPHLKIPTGPSAHPCCFAPGEIHGIALEAREGAVI